MHTALKKLYEEIKPTELTYYDFIEIVATEGLNVFQDLVDDVGLDSRDLEEMHQAFLDDNRAGYLKPVLKKGLKSSNVRFS